MYEGYLAYNGHYGYILIGQHIGSDTYEFYVTPISLYDVDYHTDIKRFKKSDLLMRGFIDLGKDENGDFVDDVEILEYLGFEDKKKTKFYVGSPVGYKKDWTYNNGWSTMETTNLLRVSYDDVLLNGFAFDNGVFADFNNGGSFDEKKFIDNLHMLQREKFYPDFIVVPDKIGVGGLESLQYSIDFMDKLEFCPFPKYLVVQDGMTREEVEPYLDSSKNKEEISFDGIFVGGKSNFKGFGKGRTTEKEWKIQTAHMWTKLAHEYGKKCHLGRVSTADRYLRAIAIGVDSCDTSSLNFKPSLFKAYKSEEYQTFLF